MQVGPCRTAPFFRARSNCVQAAHEHTNFGGAVSYGQSRSWSEGEEWKCGPHGRRNVSEDIGHISLLGGACRAGLCSSRWVFVLVSSGLVGFETASAVNF